MKRLLAVSEYITAVKDIIRQRGRPLDRTNLLLATEDPSAVKAMMKAVPKGWKIHVDQHFHHFLLYRERIWTEIPPCHTNWVVNLA